jgi:hypothetical protein
MTALRGAAPARRPRPGLNRAGPSDALDRPLRDLRISVTERCQFRCTYCMPREVFGRGFAFLPREDLLTFQELTLSSSVTQPYCRSCARTDRDADLRTRATGRTRKVEMSHIGG